MSFSETNDLDIMRPLVRASIGERPACARLDSQEAWSPRRRMPQPIAPGLVQKIEADLGKQTSTPYCLEQSLS